MTFLQRIDENWDGSHKDTIWLLGSFFNEDLGEEIVFDYVKASALIDSCAEKDSDFFLMLLRDEEKILGMLGGAITTPPFSNTKFAIEIIWYVRPQYRGNIKAVKLVKEFETWAKEKGAKYIAMVSQMNSDVDPGPLYERLGYKLSEKTYAKRL